MVDYGKKNKYVFVGLLNYKIIEILCNVRYYFFEVGCKFRMWIVDVFDFSVNVVFFI